MLFVRREFNIGKNCARGLEYGPYSAVLKTKGTALPNILDRQIQFFFFYGIALKASFGYNLDESRSLQIWRTRVFDMSGHKVMKTL